MVYNTLISSCVSENSINKDYSELLYFEVSPVKDTSFSISFQHPVGVNLACVVINVLSCKKIKCSLRINPQDATLNCSNDFITRVVERCLSVPLVMRAIFKNVVNREADGRTQNMEIVCEQNPEVTCEQSASCNNIKENMSASSTHNATVTNMQNLTVTIEESFSTTNLQISSTIMEENSSTASQHSSDGIEGRQAGCRNTASFI
ncbi:mediator of RNA polymerase II transcription subunit 1-like [Alligator mississippiensis]|uniref:Mediator of RNA polymerase II transcription subunit 1-like n=2 Tax=Alligator mississippiensis TaxID=8496 RepID=A0A151P278_ALLMI|nr:mediator of RNA polymerase II transcription subunit 1-like [Alligator mississippiensis]